MKLKDKVNLGYGRDVTGDLEIPDDLPSYVLDYFLGMLLPVNDYEMTQQHMDDMIAQAYQATGGRHKIHITCSTQ